MGLTTEFKKAIEFLKGQSNEVEPNFKSDGITQTGERRDDHENDF